MASKKHTRHRWGMGLAFGGGLLCVNPYFLLFGIPFFLLGAGLLWASKLDLLAKIALSVLPLLPPGACYACFIL